MVIEAFRVARTLKGPFVYALEDKNGIFYIGKTRNPRVRFSSYFKKHTNPHLEKRIRASADDLRIVLLKTNPPDLDAAEMEQIWLHSHLSLLNETENLLPRCCLCLERRYRGSFCRKHWEQK